MKYLLGCNIGSSLTRTFLLHIDTAKGLAAATSPRQQCQAAYGRWPDALADLIPNSTAQSYAK